MENSWMNDPSLSGISADKIRLLQNFASRSGGMNQQEMLRLLMEASGTFRKNNMNFTPDEMDLIISVLTSGKSPEETARIRKMVSMMKMMNRH